MAGQEVARGEIVIEVNDRDALSSLRRIDDQFERTMRDIDREEATVDLKADVDQLKRDLRQAKAAVTKYNNEVEAEENKVAKANKQRKLERLKLIEREAATALTAGNKRLKSYQEEGKALKLAEKRIQAIDRREQQRAATFEASEKRRQTLIKQTARVSSALNQQQLRELKSAEREAHALNVQRERELASIPKLQRGYAELESRLVKLAAARRKARGDEQALTVVKLRERETVDQMQRLMHKLRSLGQEPVSIHVDLERGARSGRFIRDAFDRGGARHAAQAAGIALGVSVGSGIDRGIRNAFRPTTVLNQGLRGLNRVRGVLDSLTNMTVRIGPFTATLRQLALAMTLFAPSILDLVGALGSMVSVVGAATLGLGALSTALVGGGIPALVGVVTVLKPMITQFKDLVGISKAYNKAVLQYGKGSEQAQAKLKQMNHALGSVDKETREAFISAGTLADRWADLTSPARASAFNIMGKGIAFLSDNLGFFAKRTNRTFDVAEDSLGRWMDALGSAEGKDLLGRMMDNFNDALGPALDGLGNLAAWLGRVGAAASRHLPILSRQFEAWSGRVLDSSDDAADLQRRVDNVVGSLKTLGRFLLASGRTLQTFFGGGVGAGETLFDDMTNALERWNRAMQTTQGQQDLNNFFERSVRGAQALYSTFGPLIGIFIDWASSLSPVVTAFFRGVGAVTNFVTALLRLTALQGPLSALAATLGALWAINRIGMATAAISNFTSALFGMSRASGAVAATTTAAAASQRLVATSTATSTAAMAASGAAAGGASKQVGTLRAAATRLVPAIGGLGAVAGGLATAGVLAVGAAAAYGVYKFATMKSHSDDLRSDLAALGDQSRAAGRAFETTAAGIGDAGSQAQRAHLNLELTRKTLQNTKKGTDEYRMALLDYRDALRYNQQAQENWQQTTENFNRAAADGTKINKRRSEIMKELTEITGNQNDAELLAAGRAGRVTSATKQHAEEIEKLRAEYQRLTEAAERAANRQAAAPLNVSRAYRGLLPVLGAAEQSLGRLARQSRGVAAKIALKFDAPKDVGRVAAQATRALRSGVPQRIVTRIVVNSADAEQALRRLDRFTIDVKRVQILEQGGQRAINMIEKIIGRKLTPKEQKLAERGGSRVVAMLERIIRRQIGDKNFTINARDHASSVIGSVIGQLNSVDGRVANSYIYTHYRSTGNRPGMRRAGGGDRSTREPVAAARSIDREQRRADAGRTPMLGRAATQRGRKITGPTLLTGEERRTEFVIATNPRYRKSNLRHLQQAGNALGAEVIPAATGFDPGGYYAPTALVGRNMRPGGGAQLGQKKLRKMSRKKKNRQKIYSRQDNWSRYIGGLHTLQDDWEREASIREQTVVEPETFLREVSRVPGETLPDGTKTDDLVKYEVDQSVVGQFQSQIQMVKDAYDKLVAITNELVGALPRAINAAQNEIGVRENNWTKFKNARDKHRGIAKASNDDDVKKHHNKLADKAQDQMKDERDEIKKLGQNETQYREDRKEAGFDQREFALSSAENQRQIDALSGRATAEAEQANEAGAGGGAGGGAGSGTPLSIDAQAALADTEKANVLREFGSNFAQAIGGALSGAGAPGSLGALSALATNPVFASAAGAAAGATLAGGGGTLSALGSTSGVTGGDATRILMGDATGTATASKDEATKSGETKITVINNYTEQPADPHTWSKGIEFELGAALG